MPAYLHEISRHYIMWIIALCYFAKPFEMKGSAMKSDSCQ